LVLGRSSRSTTSPRPPPYNYTLSLHDALPIYLSSRVSRVSKPSPTVARATPAIVCRLGRCPKRTNPRIGTRSTDRLVIKADLEADRKSTRLNSSHLVISYAVFCLKIKSRLADR